MVTLIMSVPSRETSLANLQRFIELQQAHLQRTRQDLEKLDRLGERVKADPEAFLKRMTDELNDPAFRRPPAEYLRLPAIDWSLLAGTDPSVFENLTTPRRRTLRERNPLREKLDAIVSDSGLPPVQRPVYQYNTPPDFSPVEDTSFEFNGRERTEQVQGDDEEELPDSLFGTPEADERNVRFSLPSNGHDYGDANGAKADDDPSEAEDNPTPGRRHSTTFAQPWSTHEQRLLEKHLALIPPTATQRWAKVSKAMKQDQADRTARQVASRVQKMIAKMLKMGVRPDPELWGDIVEADKEKEAKAGEKRKAEGEDGQEVKKPKPPPKAKSSAPKRG
ncbi:hypothetical protein CALCODRAFT_499171 [Calocera cornea HHB12733]|uniref:Myb-like domain-containing protein n=1 Tax=Calocera cornea HHB12733 TaxID=1353952 RepID=A0A165EJD7_9BASI|nr:hypothetical protein CALCODRAFT_499171 [Calocera cornea HHB12733]